MSEIAFIDVQPRRADTGEAVTVRLAGGGTDTPYRRAAQNYHAGVVALPRFRAAFGFDDNGWTGGTVPTNGEIGFVPGASSLMTELLGYYWRDAAITIDAGEEGGVLIRRLTGTVADVVVNEGQLQLTIADPSKLLDKPLLGAGFTGEGGIEGPSEATGRPKRRSWGRVHNVEGGLLDKVNNIYEFGDPSKPIGAFDAVRDKGRAGAVVELPWQGSIAATFTALQAADAPDGGCVAAPSIACVKWWTVPAGPLTADIRGENSGGYSETAAGIVAKMLAAVGGPALADLAAAEALRPAPCGVHIAVGADTVAQAIDRLLLGVSLYWVLQPDATIRIGEWAWGAPVASFQAIFIARERQLPPVKTRKVGYRRNHRVHSDSEISAAVILADDVSYLDGTPLEDLKPAEGGATDGATIGDDENPGNVKDGAGNPLTEDDLVTSKGTAFNTSNVGPFTTAEFTGKVEEAEADIAALFATYGDTASASAAAAAAAQAKDDAIAAAEDSEGFASISSTKRDEAAGFASAAQADAVTAGDAASVATAKAAEASDSESSAATSANLSATAKSALDISLADTMPKKFNPDLFAQVGASSGDTASITPVTVSNPDWVAPDRSYIEMSAPGLGTGLSMRGVVPVKSGDVIRLTADVEQVLSSAALTSSHFYIRVLDENFNLITSLTANGSFQNLPTGGRGVMSYDVGYDAAGLCDYNVTTGGAKYFRCQLLLNRIEGGVATQNGSTARVHAFYGENFSATALADSHAEIATTQAAAATAAASSASSSETLTATYRDAAQRAVVASIPTTFEDGTIYFGANNGGSAPANMVPHLHPNHGPDLTNTLSTAWGAVGTKARRPTTAGKKWKVRALIGHGAGTVAKATLALECWPSATGGTRIDTPSVSMNITTLTPTWHEHIFTSATDGFVCPVVLLNYPSPYTAFQRIYALELIDVDALEAATTQAGIATSQAAIATAQAAAAQQSAVLSASIGKGYINPNANYMNYPADGVPPHWTNWSIAGGTHRRRSMTQIGYNADQKPEGSDWAYAPIVPSSADNVGIQTGLPPVSPGSYIIEATAQLLSGNYTGAGLLIYMFDAAANYQGQVQLKFATTPDLFGTVGDATTGIRKWSLSFTTLSNTAYIRVYAMANYTSFAGGGAAKEIAFYKVGLKAGDAIGATVSTHSSVLATHDTKLASWLQSTSAGAGVAKISMKALDINGNAASTIDLQADRITLGSMTTPVLTISGGKATFGSDVYIQNGKIAVDTGTHMKVIGNGFGAAGQFVEWFGPKMAFNLCSEANAISYIKTNGDAYFGGSLSAGTLTNSAQTSSLATDASVIVGPFGTNGNPIVVAVSWTYTHTTTKDYLPTQMSAFNADVATYNASSSDGGFSYYGTISGTVPNSTLTLARKIGSGSFANVASGATTQTTTSFVGYPPVPYDEVNGYATITTVSVVSFTYTDNAGGISDREFRATLSRGYTGGLGSGSQRVSIVTTEE